MDHINNKVIQYIKLFDLMLCHELSFHRIPYDKIQIKWEDVCLSKDVHRYYAQYSG